MAGSTQNQNSFGVENVTAFGTTERKIEEFAFRWHLRGFSAIEGGEQVTSPKFVGGPSSQHKWQLKLTPKKIYDGMEFVGVDLVLAEIGAGHPKDGEISVKFQVTVLNENGRPGKQAGGERMEPMLFKEGSTWGFNKFMTSYDLYDPTRKMIQNDTVYVHCKIWIIGSFKHEMRTGGASKRVLPEDDMEKRRRVESGFESILQDEALSDAQLKSMTRTFKIHRVILGAKSSIFRQMFTIDMQEKRTSCVVMDVFEDCVVEGMVDHIYKGTTPLLPTRAPDLFQLAHLYDLKDLMEDCLQAMACNLNPGCAAHVLVLAHLYNEKWLKEVVSGYINCNREDVIQTEAFQQLAITHASVFAELYINQ